METETTAETQTAEPTQKSRKVDGKSKTLWLDIRENRGGKFLRITESRTRKGNRQRNHINIPDDQIAPFVEALVELQGELG